MFFIKYCKKCVRHKIHKLLYSFTFRVYDIYAIYYNRFLQNTIIFQTAVPNLTAKKSHCSFIFYIVFFNEQLGRCICGSVLNSGLHYLIILWLQI